jgi:hypothetical protein
LLVILVLDIAVTVITIIFFFNFVVRVEDGGGGTLAPSMRGRCAGSVHAKIDHLGSGEGGKRIREI